MRRVTFIAAVLVALGVSSGAWARSETITVPIDFPPVDSASVVVSGRINDTIVFLSPEFGFDQPWTNLVIRFAPVVKDTATATGLARDSVTFQLLTKIDSDSSKFWKVVGATSKIPMSSWDSTGVGATTVSAAQQATTGLGWANLGAAAGTRINLIDADSVAVRGNLFRIRTIYSAEEDSLSSHCILRARGVIDILNRLEAICMFHLR